MPTHALRLKAASIACPHMASCLKAASIYIRLHALRLKAARITRLHMASRLKAASVRQTTHTAHASSKPRISYRPPTDRARPYPHPSAPSPGGIFAGVKPDVPYQQAHFAMQAPHSPGSPTTPPTTAMLPVFSTCTSRNFYMYIQEFLHVHPGISTCTSRNFYMYTRVFLIVLPLYAVWRIDAAPGTTAMSAMPGA